MLARNSKGKGHRFKDLTGQTFGHLYVIKRIENGKRGTRYRCECDRDGNIVDVYGADLRAGDTTSCGCIKIERTLRGNIKHGHASRGGTSPEWRSLHSAITRIFNPNCKDYPDYGGRGLTMSDRYRYGENGMTGVECLVADIGRQPKGHTIGRIDNELGYVIGNVRWETDEQQANNRRDNRLITINGVTRTLTQHARAAGVPRERIKTRISLGWPAERLLSPSLPIGVRRGNRLLTINGRTQSVPEWAREVNLKVDLLHNRLRRGCPPERLLAPVDLSHSRRRKR